MYNKPVVFVIFQKYDFCGLVDSVQQSDRLIAFVQTVKAADIKKPRDGPFLGALDEHLTVVGTARFAAKRHTMIGCFLNKMR